MHFVENCIKTKVGGYVTFLDPKSGSGRTWAQCLSEAMVYQVEFIKSKL